MSEDQSSPTGPDFRQGVPLSDLSEGVMIAGHVEGEAALLVRRGDDLFAVGNSCTHYGASLSDGLIVDDTVRCPWHHACFSLRTGAAVRPPALDSVPCWQVERRGGRAVVGAKRLPASEHITTRAPRPSSIVIVGGGAAGNAAAEMLRRVGYEGRLLLVSADRETPYDRPSLSKGYLAGKTAPSSVPLRSASFYREHAIELKVGTRVGAIDPRARHVQLENGQQYGYDALLLATGADPVRLDVPGASLPHVYYLRTRADSDALIEKIDRMRRVVVVGASFIGLEVTASLRAKNLEIDVVAPDPVPMQRILGKKAGTFIRGLHERHAVRFHLGTTVAAIDTRHVRLKNGAELDADLVVVGIGVRPNTALAEQAGLAIERGVTVNEYLETSVRGIFAAGDIARWPDPLTGDHIRVEHWVVAERQGQTAARNLLGARERFTAVPFFWTEQYDFSLSYVGHGERWDQVEIDGRLDADVQDCTLTYRRETRKLAVAVVNRDHEGLAAEAELEHIENLKVKT